MPDVRVVAAGPDACRIAGMPDVCVVVVVPGSRRVAATCSDMSGVARMPGVRGVTLACNVCRVVVSAPDAHCSRILSAVVAPAPGSPTKA